MIRIIGLGPASLDRVPARARQHLLDPGVPVVLRTLAHPAAAELARLRRVEPCDDLYEQAEDFDEVYRGITARVLGRAAAGPVVYAVPGSAVVGERAVALIREAAAAAGIQVEVTPGESFLDLVLERAGADPLERGFQVLDGRIILCELGLPIWDMQAGDLMDGVEVMMASTFLFEAEGAKMVFSY